MSFRRDNVISVVLFKPLADPDGKPAGPYRVDDGWL
jgi:hypothetical protein